MLRQSAGGLLCCMEESAVPGSPFHAVSISLQESLIILVLRLQRPVHHQLASCLGEVLQVQHTVWAVVEDPCCLGLVLHWHRMLAIFPVLHLQQAGQKIRFLTLFQYVYI